MILRFNAVAQFARKLGQFDVNVESFFVPYTFFGAKIQNSKLYFSVFAKKWQDFGAKKIKRGTF